MISSTEKIDVIVNALKDDVFNKRILAILYDLRQISQVLGHRQKSKVFHNKLRSFNRMWGDEFSPKDAVVIPMLDDLFEIHGFPEERSKDK